MKENKIILFFWLIFFYSMSVYSADQTISINKDTNKYRYQTYGGLTYGYGYTTWGYLVPAKQDSLLDLSIPVKVSENGSLWGFFLGYEFNPFFALEASYMDYPEAKIHFHPSSFFSFEHDGLGGFTSHTQCIALVGKFMIQIPHNTDFRIYSSVGPAGVHRDDISKNKWTLSPNFGVGFTYLVTEHIMTEFGIVYTAGHAVSELTPADDFVPFLYSGFVRLAFRV